MPENLSIIPSTLLGLVQAYSPSGHEQEAVDFLVNRMAELHYTRAYQDEAGNAVGVMGEGPRQLVLLGHIDTVPGEIGVRVETDETTGERVLYGRGSVDAKGPLGAFVDAAAATGPIPGWQIIILGAVGEEKDSNGARFITPLYQPEFAIIGEPSRWDRLTLGYKGSAWVKLTIRRSLSHTAGQGESACEAAVKAWSVVKAWAESYNIGRPRAFDQILPTLRGMDSGSDGFEEWAELSIGTRLPLEVLPLAWVEQLSRLPGVGDIAGLSIQPTGFPISAYQGEKNTPLVRGFLAAIRNAGGQPGFVLKTGTADMNIVAPAWKCPALAYGPGDSSLDHTPNEHLAVEEYRKAVEVLRSVLKRICQPQA
jgi:[amino group carrier protein]-lysine/ornithine hydrolase